MTSDILKIIVSCVSTFAVTAGTAYLAASDSGIPTKAALITMLVGGAVQTARHLQALLTTPPATIVEPPKK